MAGKLRDQAPPWTVDKIVPGPVIAKPVASTEALQALKIEHLPVLETPQETPRRLELVLTSARIGIWDWDIVAGRFDLSDQMYKLFGLDPQAGSVGLEAWRSALHPGDLAQAESCLTQALEQRTSLNHDYRVLLPGGDIRWIEVNGEGQYDDEGKPLRMFGICQDITERRRVEVALNAEKQRLERASAAGKVALWNWDLVSGILEWSSAIDPMLGFGEEKFPRTIQAWGETLHLDDSARVAEALNGHLRGESPYEIDYRVRRTDGSYIWWHVIGVAERDTEGNAVRMAGSCADITGRKQAEEALHSSEERYRIAAETANDVLYEWDLKRAVQWQDKIDEMLGYEPGEFPRTLDGWVASLHPDDLERTMAAIKAHLEDRAPYRAEYRVRRKDGAYRWWSARGAAARTSDGTPVRWIGSITDFTERKETEDALRESESRFRQLAESLPQLVWTCQPDGPCDFLNRQWLEFTGVPEARQLGFGWLEQLHPDDRAPTVAAWEEAVASGGNFRLDFRIRRYDGEYRWFDTQSVRLRDSEGRTVKWFGSNTDMTERKEAEEEIRKLNAELDQRVQDRTAQLEAANKELEAFSYSVSHDLRAPLRHLTGFVGMLNGMDDTGLNEKSRHYLEVISESSKKMGCLIDDLLSFSRMGRGEVMKGSVDLKRLTEEVIEEIAKDIPPERIIRWRTGDLPVVTGDRAMLRLVLVNLISNAVKYSRPVEAPLIEVDALASEPNSHILFVRDNGIGFNMKYVDKLFGLFQRLHSTSEFEGTGVGLANVRRIIGRHGGRTWAEGELNHGATFYFTLPRAKEI